MKADGLRVSVEVGKLIADLDAYHYLYTNAIPTFVGAFDKANVPRGLYAKEGAMECLSGCGPMVEHSRFVSVDRIIINHRCGKCGLEFCEAQPNDPVPPSPLCVKCGQPATERFYKTAGGPDLTMAWACGDCYWPALGMRTGDDFTAGYNWLTGKDAPVRGCETCKRTRCNNCGDAGAGCGDWTDTTPPEYATHVPTPTPAAKPKGPTCWKCGKPAASFSGLYLMGVPQSDKHQWCNECHTAMTEWMRKQEILAALASNALDRSADREHAAWVRKQYQRAVDVPLVGTGGMGDTFDPRRRG